jgi:hypothetical protein
MQAIVASAPACSCGSSSCRETPKPCSGQGGNGVALHESTKKYHAPHPARRRQAPDRPRSAAAVQRLQQGPDAAACQGDGHRRRRAAGSPAGARHGRRPGRTAPRHRRHQARARRPAAGAVAGQHGPRRAHAPHGAGRDLPRGAGRGGRTGDDADRPRPRPGDLPGAAPGHERHPAVRHQPRGAHRHRLPPGGAAPAMVASRCHARLQGRADDEPGDVRTAGHPRLAVHAADRRTAPPDPFAPDPQPRDADERRRGRPRLAQGRRAAPRAARPQRLPLRHQQPKRDRDSASARRCLHRQAQRPRHARADGGRPPAAGDGARLDGRRRLVPVRGRRAGRRPTAERCDRARLARLRPHRRARHRQLLVPRLPGRPRRAARRAGRPTARSTCWATAWAATW